VQSAFRLFLKRIRYSVRQLMSSLSQGVSGSQTVTDAGSDVGEEQKMVEHGHGEESHGTGKVDFGKAKGMLGCASTSASVVAILFVLAVGGLIFFYNATAYAPMGMTTLVYHGGPLDSNKFIREVPPGRGRIFIGWLQKVYQYPSTRRTYIISERADEGDVQGSDQLDVNAKDGNLVHVQCGVYFRMVQDPATIRRFHELFGIKYVAYNDPSTDNAGWKKMLQEMIRQPLHSALQKEVANYGVIQAVSQEGKAQITANVGRVIQDRVDAAMQGHYFDISGFALKSIRPDPGVSDAMSRVIQAQQGVLAAEQQRLAGIKIAERNTAIRSSLKGNGGIEAVMQAAVDKGQVQFWVVPQGQALTLAPQAPK
jgi:regulator of protease activity HflC (stomatin/prohibitin superfamily)